MDPMKQQYECEKHGNIGGQVYTVAVMDRDTGEVADEQVFCNQCHIDFLRLNVSVATPMESSPLDETVGEA
jgi:hypothetical protein